MSGGLCRPMSIHPTAVVSKNAELARDVDVAPDGGMGGAVLPCWGVVGVPPSGLKGRRVGGEKPQISPHPVSGEAPRPLKYDGDPPRLEIGKRNTFREFSTAHRGT